MPTKNRISRTVALTVFLFLSFPSAVLCKYPGPMRFSVFWPCNGNASFCAPRILAEGTIEADTADKFVKFIVGKDQSPYYLPPKPTVCFDSPGGNLVGAIKFGSTIREREFNTCLESEYKRVVKDNPVLDEVFHKDAICASACVFALAGGVNREVGEKAKIGVHQFRSAHGSIGDGNTQFTVVALAAYLEQMGINRNMLDIASVYTPDNLYWLSAKEISQLRVENMSVVLSQWQLGSTEQGIVFAYITQTVPESHGQTSLIIIKNSEKVILSIAFEPAKKTAKDMDIAFSGADGRAIWLRVDGKLIAEYEGVRWLKGKEKLSTNIELSQEAVRQIRSGTILNVDINTPHASSEYDPSLDFQLKELSSFLPAILK